MSRRHPDPGPARDQIDRWFVGCGVPHFIEGYSARIDVWTRAFPALSLLFVLGIVLELGLAAAAGLGTFFGGVGLVVASWIGLNRWRARPLFALPRQVGRLELSLFVLIPVVVGVLRRERWLDLLLTLAGGLVLLGLVYVIVSYGLVAITRYVLGELSTQLGLLGTISSRAVPMLLLITMAIFITGETWQMASRLRGLSFTATVGLFIVIGGLFLWSRVPGVLASVGQFNHWSEVAPFLEGTPVAGIELPADGDPPEPPLTHREQLNMAVLALTTQAVQITLVAGVVWLFFVLLGVVAVHPDTSTAWLGEPSHPVGGVLAIGESRFAVTTEGLRVAAILAGFSGLTFTVYLVTDEAYRREFRSDVSDRLRQLLAVRLVDRVLAPCADAGADQRRSSASPNGSTSAAT